MANDYRVLRLDLTNARDRAAVEGVGPNVPIESITVLSLDPSASLSLAIASKELIPVAEGDKLEACPAIRDGLVFTHPSQPGVVAILYVGLAEGTSVTRSV